MNQTLLEQILTILQNSLKGGQLPILTNPDGTQYTIVYNPSTDRIERLQFDSSSGGVLEWSTYTGTRQGEDLVLTLGDYDNSGLGTKIIIDDGNEIIKVIGGNGLQVEGPFSFRTGTGDDVGFANFAFSNLTNADFVFPAGGGTFVMDSDLGTTVATLDGNGKLTASQLPDLAITDVITATENNIADFAANSGNYTFQTGDVIIIDDGSGNISHYLYNGGTKTDVNSYSLINATKIPISDVIGLQAALDDKVSLTLNEVVGGDKVFTGEIQFNNIIRSVNTSIFGLTSNNKIRLSAGNGTLEFVNPLLSGYAPSMILASEQNFMIGANVAYFIDSSLNHDFKNGNAVFGGFASTTKTNAEIDSGSGDVFIPKRWFDDNSIQNQNGTFTPTLVDLGGGATYSASTANGSYEKIGNLVFIELEMSTISTTGTPSGILQLQSLPFSPVDNCALNVIQVTGFTGATINNTLTGYSTGGNIQFQEQRGGATLMANITFNGTGAAVLRVSGTYKTT